MKTRSRVLFIIAALVAALSLVGQTLVGASSSDETAPPSDAEKVTEADLEADTLFGSEVQKISGLAFHGTSSSSTYTYAGSGGCVYGGSLSANLDLPHGADIQSVSAHIFDNGSASNGSLFLYRYPTSNTTGGTAPTSDLQYNISTGTGDDSGYQTLADSSPEDSGGNVINMNTYSYDFRWAGPHDLNTRLCGVTVLFTIPDSTNSLVFHELTPCAIFDTRSGQGGIERKLTAGETITFDTIISGGDYSSQGGASSCTAPPSGTSGSLFANPEGTVAVKINLVALNPNSAGNFKMWDSDVSEPDGGVLVFSAGSNNANELTVAVGNGSCSFLSCPSNGGEIRIKNQSSAADVRGVILGYYTRVPRNQE